MKNLKIYFDFRLNKQRKLVKLSNFCGTQDGLFKITKNNKNSALLLILLKKLIRKSDKNKKMLRERCDVLFYTKPHATNYD